MGSIILGLMGSHSEIKSHQNESSWTYIIAQTSFYEFKLKVYQKSGAINKKKSYIFAKLNLKVR